MKNAIIAILLCLALCGTAFTQNASDFTVDANGIITKYTGFDTIVVIPAAIGGKKITAIHDEAFRKADITSVTIPEGVMKIGNSTFIDNKLTSINIPNSVTFIGRSAFANNRLTSVTIPGSVKEINRDAFRGNTTLATIIISEGVETIWSGAFADTKCVNVSLPSTITSLSDSYTGAAFDLSGKPSFTLAANINAEFDSVPAFYSYIANDRKAGTYVFDLPLVSKRADDYEYYETRYGAVLIRYIGDSTRIRVPATIGGVAVKALYGRSGRYDFIGTFQNKKIVAVQIPEGITYISCNAFAENELANITIANSVKYIGGFWQNKLTSVTIPNSVIYIDAGAFSNNELTSITIPEGVTKIGNSAFRDNKLTSIIIPNSVTSIGGSAFANNRLTSVTIGSNVTLLMGNYVDKSLNYVFEHSLDVLYNNSNKAAGIYFKIVFNYWANQQLQFPTDFLGTWKRDNYNNTLTININTLKSSNQNTNDYLQRISGDVYTIITHYGEQGTGEAAINIRLVNGNLVISGDNNISGEYSWNGTWRKLQSTSQSTQPTTTQQAAANTETPVPDGFVRINGGTFVMGSPGNEPGREGSHEDQQQVRLNSFYMSKYEVTQKEYQEIMGRNPSKFKDDNLPVENVTWANAIEYCNKRSQKEGLNPAYTIRGSNVTLNQDANGYRLPNRAQWEYACRAGTTTAFNNGNNDYTNAALVGEVSWYAVNSERKTHEVGLKKPNAWGLYDMHGNVAEWCWGNVSDNTLLRVNKGGSWDSPAQNQRSAYFDIRNILTNGGSGVGIRLVRFP